MITTAPVRTWELDRNPDLVDLVSATRDAGHEVMLIERPMPDAVSVAAIGRAFDIVSAPGGVALEDVDGKTIDFESGDDRVLAASRMWRRMGCPPPPGGAGGFPICPPPTPAGPGWGFPRPLFSVPPPRASESAARRSSPRGRPPPEPAPDP